MHWVRVFTAWCVAGGGLDNADLPALFWDSMPEGAQQHPDMMALEALKEECTPEERAETFKVRPSRGSAEQHGTALSLSCPACMSGWKDAGIHAHASYSSTQYHG
jgi:hypothetical protein